RPATYPSEIGDSGHVFNQILRRCLHPDPEQRFQQAADLEEALDGCRELRRVERELPEGSLHARFRRAPFLSLAVLGLAPHVLGSAVNISYNYFRIVQNWETGYQNEFWLLVLLYNLMAYPLCVWQCVRIVEPLFRTWQRLRQ